jgi:hypothetical protein
LTLNIPTGFSTSNLTSACGTTLSANTSGSLAVNGAQIPAGGTCSFTFSLTAPTIAQLQPQKPVFTMTAASGGGLASLSSQTVPSISILGNTPGGHAWWGFPANTPLLSELDFYITPSTDPGPDSNIYWSNQIQALGGYTGLQSTMLVGGGEGVGRQFLFSLWGAINYQTGTPTSAGIGGGSFCTMSSSATDGSAGVQCRYRYEWQAGHTYRFRVTPQTSLGSGWFKTNVTDVTGGTTGDSFDIGTIQVDTTLSQYKDAMSAIPANAISQWTEYFEWNNPRATPSSVPYSSVAMSMTATDIQGKAVTVNNTEKDQTAASSTTLQNGVLTETSGIDQSSRGLFKASGACLTSQKNATSGLTVAVLNTCPTLATVRAKGGSAFSNSLWVSAVDGTIELPASYCLTAADPNGAYGSAVNVQTCTGTVSQKWNIGTANGSLHSIQSATTGGQCIVPAGSPSSDGSYALSLGSCGSTSQVWTAPGTSFSY